MLGRRHEIPHFESDFYREKFHKILRWLMASLFVVVVMLAFIIYFILFQPPQHYYANETGGQIMPMPPYVGG